MLRWLWWVPLGLLTVVGALLAFRMGWIAATITETDVITGFSQRYVDQDGGPGAQITDCVGLVGQVDGAWITVRCGAIDYHVSRFGRLIEQTGVAGQPST